jgi:hypothetical protein
MGRIGNGSCLSAQFSEALRVRLLERKRGGVLQGDLRSGSRHGQETGRNTRRRQTPEMAARSSWLEFHHGGTEKAENNCRTSRFFPGVLCASVVTALWRARLQGARVRVRVILARALRCSRAPCCWKVRCNAWSNGSGMVARSGRDFDPPAAERRNDGSRAFQGPVRWMRRTSRRVATTDALPSHVGRTWYQRHASNGRSYGRRFIE